MTRSTPLRRGALTVAAVLVFCANAVAQIQPRTVEDVLAFLVTNQGVETGDFDRDREAAEATRATLTRALLASLAQLPVSTSSGGFAYRLNPALGSAERTSDSFGPFFVERALTSGTGQASFGVSFQYRSFTSLDGHDLGDGAFVTVANQFRDEARPFDVETLTLHIATRTATLFGSVGVTDRIDLSAAVPLVWLDISGARVNTYRGRSLLQARARARTMGLADTAIRTRIRLTRDGPADAAAGIEVRLPTGREENLLGAGRVAWRFTGIGSADLGAASVHANLTFGTGGLGREVSYSGAVAFAPTLRLTVVGELLGRRLAGTAPIAAVVAPHPRIAGVDTTRLMPIGGDRTLTMAVAGVKWNVGGRWLVHGSVLMPLAGRGLTGRLTPTIAMDYSFTR